MSVFEETDVYMTRAKKEDDDDDEEEEDRFRKHLNHIVPTTRVTCPTDFSELDSLSFVHPYEYFHHDHFSPLTGTY